MSPTLRRLMKEAAELSASSPSPSPHFCAHPVSESNLFDWHFTIAGPPAPSPYANGIYHGRIVLPPQYPLRPPSFRFLTPSGRFEVNREICLSISGHHEETWQPAWGIRTALTAIRSFMDGGAKGQIGGLDATDDVRRMWAEKSRSWRCEVCTGRKSNEAVLTEWREMCRQKGISVDEEGKEVVPDQLRLHYKKSQPADGEAEPTTTSQTASSQTSVSGTSAQVPSNAIPATQVTIGSESHTEVRAQNRESTAANATDLPSAEPSSSTTSSGPDPSSSSTIPQRPIPTPTLANQPRRASFHGPWLDRAIIGVVIALVLMVLRKFT